MSFTLRPARERGHYDHGWLETYHTFSFARYHDPAHMGFRALRVLNDDTVAPGAGFGMHPHDNMEIVSYVLDGALEHRDSMGTGSVLHAGDVQRMSAGTGVTHSEFNHSHDAPVHFLQIWLLPAARDIAPSYEERHFGEERLRGAFHPIVAPDGERDSLTIRQDARILAAVLANGESATHALGSQRHGWVHIARGAAFVDGHAMAAGDGAAVHGQPSLTCEAPERAEILLFDLA